MKIVNHDPGVVLSVPDPRGVQHVIKNLHYDVPTVFPIQRFEDQRGSVEILLEDELKVPVIIKRAVSTLGAVRGFHWQEEPSPQVKLIYVLQGAICDVTMRVEDSWPNPKEVHVINLYGGGSQCLYIPADYAHAYQSISDESIVLYVCVGAYNADAEHSFHPLKLGVDWPVIPVTMSQKDMDGKYRE